MNEERIETIEVIENEEEMAEPIGSCACCDEPIFENDDYCDTPDGYVCQSCFEENYGYCDDCGRIYPVDYGHCVERGDRFVCGRCFEHYSQCADCGEYYHDDDMTEVRGCSLVCNRCLQDYSYCDECGEYVWWEDYNGDECCCEECVNSSNKIGSYHSHHGKWKFFGEDKMKMFGIELEVENDKDTTDRDEMAEIINDISGDRLYFEYDGSLDNGFEIISHPHTVEEFENIDWKAILERLISHGYLSHYAETCGLHVHVSRGWFGVNEDLNIAKLLLCYSYNWRFFLKCSRRTQAQADRWAAEYCTKDIEEAKEKVKNLKGYGRQYLAVNLANYATVEFRLGRGTLLFDSFKAWIDIHVTLAKNAQSIPEDRATDLTLWLKGISENTKQYIERRTGLTYWETEKNGGEM